MICHILGLFWQNKVMQEGRKMYESVSLIGTITAAVSLPLVAFKVFKTLYLQQGIKKLTGKVVVITGASSGLGEALAHEFYQKGCQVILCSRRKDQLDRVKNDLLHSHCPNAKSHSPIVVPVDLADIDSLPECINKILSITGHIDILINNAGLSCRGKVIDMDINVHMQIMKVNYFGAIALTKAVLPGMVTRRSGIIVFVSSVQGLISIPERSAYSASKHALQAFADSLRAEVAGYNIMVNVVTAGYIKTELSLNALTHSGDKYAKMDETTANGYKPEVVAGKILKAVAAQEKEIIVAPLVSRLAIFLRHFLPSLYFFVMARRFKKQNSFT